MSGSDRRNLYRLFGLAAVFTIAAACSTTSSSPANAVAPPATDPAGDDAGAGDEASPTTKPSCDPYEPRATVPDLFIGPKGLEQKLDGIIAKAEKSIDLLIYELDTKSILDALAAAAKRGVVVRIVVDRNQSAGPKAALAGSGVQLKDSSADFSYAHAKTMIVDGTSAVIMSMNMNSYSMNGERNYGVVDVEPDDVASAQQVFDHDWNGGGMDGLSLPCTRLLVSPINARDRIADLLKRAKKTLDLSVMYLTDAQLVDALEAQKTAGVAVRVLLADPGWIQDNPKTATKLAAAGIPVKYFKQLDLHAKLVLTEDAAFVGSENLSANSLDQNREVGVIVTNPEPVAAIRKQFESDWSAGVAP